MYLKEKRIKHGKKRKRKIAKRIDAKCVGFSRWCDSADARLNHGQYCD